MRSTVEPYKELCLATGLDDHGSIRDIRVFTYLILYLS